MDYKGIVTDSIQETVSKMLGVTSTKTLEENAESSPIKVEDFTIIIGIAGTITGQLIFGFKEEVVKKIAEKMIEQEVENLDELAISAVSELTNVLSGNATINLVEAGSKKLGMSPPSIVMGKSMRISTKINPITRYKIKVESFGDITLHIALKEKEE